MVRSKSNFALKFSEDPVILNVKFRQKVTRFWRCGVKKIALSITLAVGLYSILYYIRSHDRAASIKIIGVFMQSACVAAY